MDSATSSSPTQEGMPSRPDTPSVAGDNAFPTVSFPLLRLPAELQAMIWDMTLPEPRVIEIVERWPDSDFAPPGVDQSAPQHEEDAENADAPDETDETDNADLDWDSADEVDSDSGEHMGLQLAGSLPTFMAMDHGWRGTSTEPFETCRVPVALHVCRDSRAQGLRRYVPMIDSTADGYSFYMDPLRDALWLSIDITDDGPEKVAEPRKHYGEQLDRIQNIIVGEANWEDGGGPAEYCTRFLDDNFRGLRVVTILMESYEFEAQEREDVSPTAPDEYPRVANRMANRDRAVLGQRNWTMEYVDRDDNMYQRVVLGHR